jgi:PAS domain S-box-containing protein
MAQSGLSIHHSHGNSDTISPAVDVSARIQKTRLALVGIFLLLTAMTAYLIFSNYVAQRKLNSAFEQQLRNHAEKVAMGVDTFIAERCRDIETLSTANAVHAYFANKSLGMSMQYGLKASLDSVSEIFQRVSETVETVDCRPVFAGIALFDMDGRTVHLQKHPETSPPPSLLVPKFIVPDTVKPTVAINGPEPEFLIISCAVSSHNKALGTVAAAVRMQAVLNQEATETISRLSSRVSLVSQQPGRHGPDGKADLRAPWAEKIEIDGAPGLLVNSPLHRFPLSVLTEIDTAEFSPGLGALSMVVGVSLLMVFVMGGEIFLLRTLNRHFRLQASYEAASKQREEVECQNRLLELEIRERVQAEKALRTSEQRLEAALMGADLGTWDWDVASGRVIFNKRWAEKLGYALDEIDPHVKSWEQRVHPDDMPRIRKILTDHLEGKTPYYESEHRLLAKNGAWKWILDKGKVIDRNAEGRPLRVVGTHLDITDRRLRDEMIRSERDLLAALSRALSLDETLSLCIAKAIEVSRMDCGGLYLVNDDGSVVLAAHQGFPEAFVHSVSRYEPGDENHRMIMAGTPVYTRHERIRSGKGQTPDAGLKAIAVLPIRIRNRVIACMNIGSRKHDTVPTASRGSLEKFSLFIGSFIAQARQRDEIQKSRKDFETLFNTVDEFLFILDMQGRIIHSNAVVAARLGYTEAELNNTSVLSLHPEPDRETAQKTITDMLAGRNAYCNIPLQKKDGGCIPVETKITRGTWNGQEVLIGLSRDISERVKAEAELKKYQEQLETMVRQRTRALEQTQKELVNKAMEAGYAQMAAMVLHNVGNIISPAYLHIERLKTGTLDNCLILLGDCHRDLAEHRRELTGYVTASARGKEVFSYMEKLIKEAVNLQRVRAGRIEKISQSVHHIGEILKIQQVYSKTAHDVKESTDINRVVSDILTMQESALNKREISVKTDLLPNPPRIRVSKAKLSQVLVNLIKNAYESIEERSAVTGPRKIAVRTHLSDKGLVVDIRDTGIGIAPELLKHISVTGRSTKGSTGFGLNYCRLFMEQIGGKLTMDSQQGEGTTVTLAFPVAKAPGAGLAVDANGAPSFHGAAVDYAQSE